MCFQKMCFPGEAMFAFNFRFSCSNFDGHFEGKKNQDTFFWLHVHRMLSNTAIFRKF